MTSKNYYLSENIFISQVEKICRKRMAYIELDFFFRSYKGDQKELLEASENGDAGTVNKLLGYRRKTNINSENTGI